MKTTLEDVLIGSASHTVCPPEQGIPMSQEKKEFSLTDMSWGSNAKYWAKVESGKIVTLKLYNGGTLHSVQRFYNVNSFAAII